MLRLLLACHCGQKVAVMPDSQKVAVTPDSQKVAVTPDIQKVAVMPDDQKVAVTPDSQKVAVTPDDQKVAVTPDSQKVAVTLEASHWPVSFPQSTTQQVLLQVYIWSNLLLCTLASLSVSSSDEREGNMLTSVHHVKCSMLF